VRLAHFSDIHVTAARCRWRPEDLFNKRLPAWINLRLLGRGFRFRCTDEVLASLRQELHQRGYDRIIFSGDATALGFREEVARAAALLEVGRPGGLPGLAVPGNHDYCTRTTVAAGHFEHYFAPWQQGERVGAEVYPFAQRVGPAWLVAVNSAVANRWPWDARGTVGAAQLARLELLLDRLADGPRILVTHYPIRVASGKPEVRIRALRDLHELLEVARRGGVSLWLHGHRHGAYYHPPSEDVPFPVICAGSATQNGFWSYSEYVLSEHTLRATQRVYQPSLGRFEEGPSFELELTPRSGKT
jgi:3',5'-cyclic AMP phosphodiesterase CpdA